MLKLVPQRDAYGVRLLLQNAAATEAKDTFGKTPLHYAAGSRHIVVLELLLSNRANIEAEGEFGLTPLHYAAESGHEAVVKSLLKKGAAIEAKDTVCQTPFHRAAKGGATTKPEEGLARMLIYRTVEDGHAAVLRLLLGEGADIEARGY